MNRNSKVIKGIGVVALSGVVATSALTMTGCGKKTSKADSVVITLADEENNGVDCLSSTWLPLSEKSDNPTFRENFETLTHNRTSETGLKEGTIYYTSNPTLQSSLKNTAFTNLFDSLDTTTLLSLTSDLYLDIDENTPNEVIKAAVINEYFGLFNVKANANQNEFNATQRISRVDFISAVVKSTTSPQSNESSLSENEIMSKLSDKSYLGNNNTNNTETGIITKAEAAYLVCNTLFNNEMSEKKASKPAENLQSCLESGKLSSDLRESLEILENKGIVSSDYSSSWNKALNKSEAVDLIYTGLSASGLNSSEAVNEDVIADEIAEAEKKAAEEAARALEEARENAIEEVNGFNSITSKAKEVFLSQLNQASSIDKIDEILTEAREREDLYARTADSRRVISGRVTTGGGEPIHVEVPSDDPNRGKGGEVVDTGGTNGNTVDWDKEVDGPQWR